MCGRLVDTLRSASLRFQPPRRFITCGRRRKSVTSPSPSITAPNDASSLHRQHTQSLIQNNMLHTLSLLNCVRQRVRVTGNLPPPSPSITAPNDASSLHRQHTQSLIQNNTLHTLSLLPCVRQGVRVTGNLSLHSRC